MSGTDKDCDHIDGDGNSCGEPVEWVMHHPKYGYQSFACDGHKEDLRGDEETAIPIEEVDPSC